MFCLKNWVIAKIFRSIVEATNEPVGQMTIFYSGKVNVFDDISVEKVMKKKLTKNLYM